MPVRHPLSRYSYGREDMMFGFGIVGGAGAAAGLEAQRVKSHNQFLYEQAAVLREGRLNAQRLMDAVYCAPRGPSGASCAGCGAPSARYDHHCTYCKRPR